MDVLPGRGSEAERVEAHEHGGGEEPSPNQKERPMRTTTALLSMLLLTGGLHTSTVGAATDPTCNCTSTCSAQFQACSAVGQAGHLLAVRRRRDPHGVRRRLSSGSARTGCGLTKGRAPTMHLRGTSWLAPLHQTQGIASPPRRSALTNKEGVRSRSSAPRPAANAVRCWSAQSQVSGSGRTQFLRSRAGRRRCPVAIPFGSAIPSFVCSAATWTAQPAKGLIEMAAFSRAG
jgi:hypothetical protein